MHRSSRTPQDPKRLPLPVGKRERTIFALACPHRLAVGRLPVAAVCLVLATVCAAKTLCPFSAARPQAVSRNCFSALDAVRKALGDPAVRSEVVQISVYQGSNRVKKKTRDPL